MYIGIVGTGSVGRALAAGLTAAGHDVVLGSRDPEGTDVAVDGAEADRIDVVTQRTAADHGDVVVLALPADVVVDVAGALGDVLGGTTLIDAANEYPAAGSDRSLAARVADAAPRAHVVKAFNTVGANRMTAPVLDGAPATMFVAGDDPEAVAAASGLAADLGFDPVRAGDLSAAGHLEHLARFWIHLSREYGRDIAFRLLREGP